MESSSDAKNHSFVTSIKQEQKVEYGFAQVKSGTKTRKIGNYNILHCIGKGACGKVYKGIESVTGNYVAIKQMILQNTKDNHKNSISTQTHLYIILEFVGCGSLDKIRKVNNGFTESNIASYTIQILQGLDYLHSQGVVHRDIKGANILLSEEGVIKLADFGVATLLSDNQKTQSLTGTPYWMAPEVIDSNGNVTTLCDIWSLACTIIELLTGKPPFYEKNQYQAMFRIVNESIPIPEDISEELKDFLK